MDRFNDYFSNGLNYIRTIGVTDILDILIVALLIYELLRLTRKSNVLQVAKGILVLLVVLWLSGVMRLTVLNFLLRRAVELGLIALLILFQPELRRALEKVGSRSRLTGIFGSEYQSLHVDAAITQTVLACRDMSAAKTGALIIFARDNLLSEPISTGTMVDAAVSAELLKNLFFKNSPLHDGAVIVRDGRVTAAGCILPVSRSLNISKELGTRHRAGIGISEQSDAVVVIVSEETGSISVAEDGMLKRHLSPETLEVLLRKALLPTEEPARKKFNLMDLFRGKKHE